MLELILDKHPGIDNKPNPYLDFKRSDTLPYWIPREGMARRVRGNVKVAKKSGTKSNHQRNGSRKSGPKTGVRGWAIGGGGGRLGVGNSVLQSPSQNDPTWRGYAGLKKRDMSHSARDDLFVIWSIKTWMKIHLLHNSPNIRCNNSWHKIH